MADPYASFSSPTSDPYAAFSSPVGQTKEPPAMSVATPPLAGGPRQVPASMVSNPPPRGFIDRAIGGIDRASQYASDLVTNIPSDALEVGKGVVNALAHPIDTTKTLGSIAAGVINKTGRPGNFLREGDLSPTSDEMARRAEIEGPANALAAHYAQAYGSIQAALETLRTRPVSTALDIATVANPVGGALAKAPGAVGRVGEIVSDVGRAVDPLTSVGQGVRGGLKVAEPVISHEAGFASGAGAESVRQAARTGREGGAVGETFRENLRGEVPVTDVVDKAKAAVAQMREERSAAYKAGMGDVAKDNTPLSFAPIDQAVDKAKNVGTFKGQTGTAPAVTIEPKAAAVINEIDGLVSAWRYLDPAEFHTPVGIDALKRAVGNIRDSTLPNTPERVAANRVYTAISGELTKAAPDYSKTMADYAKASERLNETTKTLSVGEKVTGDTAARKLLSATRTNVQTNFGGRQKLINALTQYDKTLPAAIAGQVMQSPLPQGIVSRGGLMALGLGAFTNPMTAPLVLTASPRLVGEAAHAGGRAVGATERGLNALHITPDTWRALEQLGYVTDTTNRNALVR